MGKTGNRNKKMHIRSRYWIGKYWDKKIGSRKRHSSKLFISQKIFPSLQYPFPIIMAQIVQREGRGEHVGESVDFFPYLNNCVLPFIFSTWCQTFTCSLLEKYSRNSPEPAGVKARSSKYQQKEGLLCPCSQ